MADLSDDHGCVDAMYALYRQGFAVVSASRYAPGGAQRGGPWVKGLLSRVAGASLRLVAELPTWDATNSFKLYSREFLDSVELESEGGFELALELTVKAHLQGRRIAELPTVWTERASGQSRFQLRKWLPHYLRWYLLGMRSRWRARRSRAR
jgi:dolichol-phosphate mannosyltransferase